MPNTLEAFEIETEFRPCDLCGSGELIEVNSYNTVHNTRNLKTAWSIRNVVCADCGFAFVSPAPKEACLTRYYQDNHALFYTDAHAQFDEIYHESAHRTALIEKYLDRHRGGLFVEIGGNTTHSARALEQHFDELVNVELNASAGAEVQSLSSLHPESATVIASYYVLEHIRSPKDFLGAIRRVISRTGIVFIEVPDANLYPADQTAFNFHEHVNHFTPDTLVALAAEVGFETIEISHEHRSMAFGFVAVLRPADSARDFDINKLNVLKSLSVMRGGAAAVVHRQKAIAAETDKLRALRAEKGSLVLWGANRLCMELLADQRLAGEVVVIDSNPDKKRFIEGIEVKVPAEALDVLRAAPIIYFCAPIKDIVLTQLARDFEIDLRARELIVTRFST